MIVFGAGPVREALENAGHRVQKLLVADGRSLDADIKALVSTMGIKVQSVPKEKIAKLTGTHKHQGIAAVIAPLTYMDAQDAMCAIRENNGIGVLLHDLYDPGNIGAVARTCLFLGAQALIIAGHHTPGITEAGVKASAGAVFKLPIAKIGNPKPFVEKFKAAGGWVIGLTLEGKDIREVKLPRPLLLVLGNESKGVPKKLSESCDEIARIPGSSIDSLNVSVAAAIGLWEFIRRR